MILIIDNYDSFTWNIYQYFSELGAKVIVYRNDEISINDTIKLNPTKIIISPGPSSPNQSGVSLEIIRYYAGILPILGICLGHQAIAQTFGANIIRARKVMHGKISPIIHNNKGVFLGLNNPLNVVRYHSLIIELSTLPSCLEITAWSKDTNEIMGIRHRKWYIEGVQFHPESILSDRGHDLFKNFLNGDKY